MPLVAGPRRSANTREQVRRRILIPDWLIITVLIPYWLQVQRITELISSQNGAEDSNSVDTTATKGQRELLTAANNVPEEAEEEAIDESDLWLVKYDELAQKSKTIPLSHLGCCKEGADLFR